MRIGDGMDTSDVNFLQSCHFKPVAATKKKFGFIPVGTKTVLQREYNSGSGGISPKERCEVHNNGKISCHPIPFPLLKSLLLSKPEECVPRDMPPPPPPVSVSVPYGATPEGGDDEKKRHRKRGRRKRRTTRKEPAAADEETRTPEPTRATPKKDMNKSEIIQLRLMAKSMSGKNKRERADILSRYAEKRAAKLRYKTSKDGTKKLYQLTKEGKLAQIASGPEVEEIIKKHGVQAVVSAQLPVGSGIERPYDPAIATVNTHLGEVSYAMFTAMPSCFLFGLANTGGEALMGTVEDMKAALLSHVADLTKSGVPMPQELPRVIDEDWQVMRATYTGILAEASSVVDDAREAQDAYDTAVARFPSGEHPSVSAQEAAARLMAELDLEDANTALAKRLLKAVVQKKYYSDQVKTLYSNPARAYMPTVIDALLKDVVQQCGTNKTPKGEERGTYLNRENIIQLSRSAYTTLFLAQTAPTTSVQAELNHDPHNMNNLEASSPSDEDVSERYASAPSDTDSDLEEDYEPAYKGRTKPIGAKTGDEKPGTASSASESSSEEEEEESDKKKSTKPEEQKRKDKGAAKETKEKKEESKEEKEEEEEEEEESENKKESSQAPRWESEFVPFTREQDMRPMLAFPPPVEEQRAIPLFPAPNPYLEPGSGAESGAWWESGSFTSGNSGGKSTDGKQTSGCKCPVPEQKNVGGLLTDVYNRGRTLLGELPVYAKLGIADCRYPPQEVAFFDKCPSAENIDIGCRSRPYGVNVEVIFNQCDKTKIFDMSSPMSVGVHHVNGCFKSWLYEWVLTGEQAACTTMRVSKRHQVQVCIVLTNSAFQTNKISTGLLSLNPSCTSGIYYLRDCEMLVHLNFQQDVATVQRACVDPCANPCAPPPRIKRIVTFTLCSVRVIEKCP